MKITVLLTMLVSVSFTHAATLVFDGEIDNSTILAQNWDLDQVPTAADDLIIGAAFNATGSSGGGTGTQANSITILGTLSGTWGLVPFTIDGGSLTLSGAGAAFTTGSANLLNNGTLTFTSKTATEVVAQYGANFTVGGAAAVFGVDPLVAEPGDNILITENAGTGADNVTVSPLTVPEPSSVALLGLGGLALMFRRRK